MKVTVVQNREHLVISWQNLKSPSNIMVGGERVELPTSSV